MSGLSKFARGGGAPAPAPSKNQGRFGGGGGVVGACAPPPQAATRRESQARLRMRAIIFASSRCHPRPSRRLEGQKWFVRQRRSR